MDERAYRHVHFDTDRYDLAIRTGRSVAVIHTTSNHLFWDQASRRWVTAAALRPGTHLRTAAGTAVAVADGRSPPARSGWMWDLTVAADHDFYVRAGHRSVLVHNCGGYDLYHGTDVESAQNIVDNGISQSQAAVLSRKSQHKPSRISARI